MHLLPRTPLAGAFLAIGLFGSIGYATLCAFLGLDGLIALSQSIIASLAPNRALTVPIRLSAIACGLGILML
jgi:hypothetical protein